jgi:hypothetical protein
VTTLVDAADALFHTRADLERALALYEASLREGIDPLEVAQRRWMCAMLLGDFESAWRLSDEVLAERRRRRLSCEGQPRHLRWVWDGSPLDAREVLVRCHHGLGDIIQFIRLAAPLRRVARRVTVEAPTALIPLIETCEGVDAVLPLDGENFPAEAEIELMELPHALRLQLADIPNAVPYLTLPPSLVAERRRALPARPVVGVVGTAGAWRPERSVPPSLLNTISSVANIAFVNLQQGAPPPGFPGMRSDPAWTRTIIDTGATVLGVDLVITVDTMVAHLAGALGVPTWLLLHFEADWRWMTDRTDSAWYPTLRLIRQPGPGDWPSVIARVRSELARAL